VVFNEEQKARLCRLNLLNIVKFISYKSVENDDNFSSMHIQGYMPGIDRTELIAAR
jgi:hypothetical protein